MKINEKILNLPPYISTTWNNITAIAMRGSQLAITLKDGDSIHIPDLNEETIELIFTTHAEHIEKNSIQEYLTNKIKMEEETCQSSIFSQNLFDDSHKAEPSLKFGFASLDGLNTVMQHNPLEMNAPDLPHALLDKIGSIAKIIAPEEGALLPQEVPNCNCFHCQITRKIKGTINNPLQEIDHKEEEELVSDEELQFCQWDITPSGENLFTVTNKLDITEQYSVYLGNPVGCNCGTPNCEHIIAALRD